MFATLKTFGMEKGDKIRFVSGCLRTWYFAKRWFPKDGVRTVVLMQHSHALFGIAKDYRRVFFFYSKFLSVFCLLI